MADKIPDNLRAFDDMDAARKWMREGAIEALGKRFPIEDDTYRLELADPHFERENSEYGMKRQKEALLKRGYLADSVKGTWRLVEKKTGRVMDERPMTVMRVPYLTNRGTFIYNGNEYSAASQSRLKHGVYTRRRQSGEIESFYSIKPGTGRNFKMWMEPRTGVFKMNVGQANIPLYPLLRELGMSDEQLAASWGKEIAAANADTNWDARDMRRYYEKFLNKSPGDMADTDVRAAVKAAITRAEVDPWVVSRTLGLENVSHVSPEMLLRGAQKILNVSRGSENPDDRNAPMFSRILSPEDFIRERIENDAGRVARTLLFKARRVGNLSRVPAGALDSYTKEYLMKSRLTQPLEETNPLSLLEQMSRVTRMGEGGIGSAEAVTADARDVNLGQLGFIDPIQGPECFTPGAEILTDNGFKPIEEIDTDTLILAYPNQINFKLPRVVTLTKPSRMISTYYKGRILEIKDGPAACSVTINHKFWCRFPEEKQFSFKMGFALLGRSFYVLVDTNMKTEFLVKAEDVHISDYQGMIHCLQVDGGMMFARHGGSATGHWTGNSETIGIDTRVSHRTFKGKDGQMYGEFRDARTGKTVYLRPEDVDGKSIAFPGELASGKPTVYASSGGKIKEIPREEADYELPSFGHMMSAMTNLNPMPTSVQAARQFYGSKFWGQYMPATKGEIPLVDSVSDDGTSFSEYYGRRVGCIPAKKGGKVLAVKDDVLKVRYDDGSKSEIDLVKNLPMNRLTQMSYDTGLKAGDTFKEGDILAYNNFVDPKTGGFAMGHNLKVAVVPYLGYSHEDAQVFSESAAKKLSTNRLYGFDQDFDNDVAVNFNKFTALFPDKFTKEQLKGIDKNGVVKPGTVLNYGDPIMLAVGPKLLGPEDIQLGKLSKALRHAQTDRSQVWEHQYPGTVTDAEITSKGVSVNVKADVPLEVGDKCCYSQDTEVYTRDGWLKFIDLTTDDEVAALDPETLQWDWVKPREIMSFDHDGGKMYRFQSPFIDLYVTENHNLFVKDLDNMDCRLVEARYCEGRHLAAFHASPHGMGKFGNAGQEDVHDLPDPSVETHWYHGKVWCCELPKWHVLYVRRGGKAVWCGNSTRYGLKGTCGRIVPDDKMPRDPATNEPYDVLLNPMTILSRVAPNQLMEIGLGKVAKKTGQPYRLPQLPPPQGWAQWALEQMKQAGVPEKEELFDPESGKNIPPVMTGYMYVLPFHHLSEKKLSGRGSSGVAYSSDELPVKGGGAGAQAKRMSGMDNTALICHGALDVLKDSQTVRGARNDEFWKALKLGQPLPEPKIPFVYEKFINLMKAGGINVMKRGNNNLDLLPMTDKDIEKSSGGAIDEAQMVDKDMEPVKGGLFDTARTGGLSGKKWTHIDLSEPLPNPVYEEPICRMLGLSRKQFRNILAGRETLDGEYGGLAFKKALSAIDIDKEIEKNKNLAYNGKGNIRDNAVKCLGYLTALKKQELHPKDWIISKVPVLPPVFRPVSRLGNTLLQADINELYRDVIESSKSLKSLRQDLPDKNLHDEREALYDSVSAAFGLGDPITPEGAAKGLKGALRTITGNGSPKFGFYQSRVLSKPMDMVGRGVITPNPNADMDSIGLPEDKAWELYKDFILRRLTRNNVPPLRALEMIEHRDPAAKRALMDELNYRPVLMDRAPTWHKFNILAYKPYLVEGKTVRVSPLILAGINGDFDGDFQLNFVFVASNSATPASTRRELEKFGKGIDVTLKRNSVVTLDKDKYTVHAVDISDFPHGELVGRRRDKKYNIDFYSVPKGVKVFAYDEKTGKISLADVSGWSIHRGKQLEIVTLSGGEQVYTDDDPRGLYGIDPNGHFGFDMVRMTPSEALKKGLYVPVSSESLVPTNVGLYLDPATMEISPDGGIPMSFNFGVVVSILAIRGADTGRQDVMAALDHYSQAAGLSPEVVSKLSESMYTPELSERRLPVWFHSGNSEFLSGMAIGMMLAGGSMSLYTRKRVSPEVMISIESSSFGLMRDFRRVLRMLDIHSCISTSRKGTSWKLSINPSDVKRTKLFNRLPAGDMKALWIDHKASISLNYSKNDFIPVPKSARVAITRFISQKHFCNLYHTIFESCRRGGYVTRECGFRIQQVAEDMKKKYEADHEAACDVLDRLLGEHKEATEPFRVSEKDRKVILSGIEAVSPYSAFGAGSNKTKEARKAAMELKNEVYPDTLHVLSRYFANAQPCVGLVSDPQYRKFMHMVESPVTWRRVEKVEKTEKVVEGYDLTVPGYETFMSTDGVILSNTVNFHVPVSDKAVENALEKMLPSRNLISLTDLRESMQNPRQEMALGLYALTRPASNKPPVRFRTAEEAKQAYRKGLIKANDPIIIG